MNSVRLCFIAASILVSSSAAAQDSVSDFWGSGLTLEVSYERGNIDAPNESLRNTINQQGSGFNFPPLLNLDFGSENRTANGVLRITGVDQDAVSGSSQNQNSGRLFDTSDEFTAALSFDVTPSLTVLTRASYARLSVDGGGYSLNETFNTTVTGAIDFQNPNPCDPPVLCIIAPPEDFYDIPNAQINFNDARSQTLSFDTAGIYAIEIGARFKPQFLAFEVAEKSVRLYAELSGGLAHIDDISASISGTGTRITDLVRSDEFRTATFNSGAFASPIQLNATATAFNDSIEVSKSGVSPVAGLAAGVDIEITPQDHILLNVGYRRLTVDTNVSNGDYGLNTTKFGIRYAHTF